MVMAKKAVRHPFMYPYLEYAIQVRRARIGLIAQELGMTDDSLSRKLHGKSPLRLDEAVQIKKILGVKWSLDKLFYVIDDSNLGGREDGDFA